MIEHLSKGIEYGTLFFQHSNALALLSSYLTWSLDGILFGIWVVMTIMPRKVLVTDGALVLKMRSPLFFRVPITNIAGVELVNGWTAWREILKLNALPVYPWFLRGLLIHRKSGRSLVIHTRDDRTFKELLSSQVESYEVSPSHFAITVPK